MKKLLIILASVVVSSSYAQNNIKVPASEIDSLGIEFVVEDQVVNKNTFEMVLNQKFKTQIIAYKKDGSKISTPLKGKEGLARNQFNIEVMGGFAEQGWGISNEKYFIPGSYSSIPFVDGFACIKVTIAHKDNPDKKYTQTCKVRRPKANEMFFDFYGHDLQLDVSYEENSSYPLIIKVNFLSYPEKNSTIRIDPETEIITFSTSGKDGYKAWGSGSSINQPEAGTNAGNITIIFRGDKASSHEDKITLMALGGRGGAGGLGYATARDGRDGIIKVFKKPSTAVTPTTTTTTTKLATTTTKPTTTASSTSSTPATKTVTGTVALTAATVKPLDKTKPGYFGDKNSNNIITFEGYKNDKGFYGESRTYSDEGKLVVIYTYVNDEKTGYSAMYDEESGNIIESGNYKAGEKDGEWKRYKDGKVVGTDTYVNGEKQ